MNRALLAIAVSFGLAGAASAQAALGDVTMSTDPAKAAAVEQHAAELKSSQHAAEHGTKSTAEHGSKSTAKHHNAKTTSHHHSQSKSSVKN
jgi:uncharacterized cupredoxin-like copper-binding protein